MRLVLVSILLVSILAPGRTGRTEGLSYLGMCSRTWDCDKTLAAWRGEPFGWIENSFGEECGCVDRFLSTSVNKVVRVHILNGPCMRNRRCGRYEAFYGYTPSSASRAILRKKGKLLGRIDAIIARLKERLDRANGKVTCYVSPCLECDLNDRARRSLLHRVSVALPNCNLVDSPHRDSCIRGTVCEGHGDSPNVTKPCIVDLDGTSADKVDLKKWLAKYRYCDIRFVWRPWMNCISLKGGPQFIDPRKRGCGAPP